MTADELLGKFESLQSFVKDKIAYEETQFKSIGAFGSILISILLSGAGLLGALWLRILDYWIPAAFLLAVIWYVLLAILMIASPFKVLDKQQLRQRLLYALKTSASASYALGVVYIISLIPLSLIRSGTVTVTVPFSSTIPLIAVIFTIITSFITPEVSIKFTENNDYFEMFYRTYRVSAAIKSKNPDLVKDESHLSTYRKLNLWIGVGLLSFIVATIILYVIAFKDTLSLITNIPLVVGFTALLFAISLILQRYFSSQEAKNDLFRSIDELHSINNKINKLKLENTFTEKEYEELKKRYLIARKWDIKLNDAFKILQTYSFEINSDYFDNMFK